MKLIYCFIILLCICISVQSQTTSTTLELKASDLNLRMFGGRISPTSTDTGRQKVSEAPYDTIPVLMLCSDTSDYIEFYDDEGLGHNGGSVEYYFGYSVSKKYNMSVLLGGTYTYSPSTENYLFPSYKEHLYYLDQHKRPLKKGVYVWLAVEHKH